MTVSTIRFNGSNANACVPKTAPRFAGSDVEVSGGGMCELPPEAFSRRDRVTLHSDSEPVVLTPRQPGHALSRFWHNRIVPAWNYVFGSNL